MFEQFEENAILINEIEAIAELDLRDIKCIFKDEEDYYETIDKDDCYIWDTVGKHTSRSLSEIRTDLDNGYTAIPF